MEPSLGLTPEQLAMRLTGVGGSEIAMIAGAYPGKNYGPARVFLSKIGQLPFVETELTEWGHRNEPSIAVAYSEKHDRALLFNPRSTFRHPKHPIALASPDRIRVEGPVATAAAERLVQSLPPGLWAYARTELSDIPGEEWQRNTQIKNVNQFKAGEWSEEEPEPPLHYVIQVTWEMGVIGLPCSDVVALVGGHAYQEKTVHFDVELFGHLVVIAEKFFRDHVEKGVMPVDASDEARGYLLRRFGEPPSPVRAATEFEIKTLQNIELLRADRAAADEALGLQMNLLIASVGDAAGIEGPACKAKRKFVRGGPVAYDREDRWELDVRFPRKKKTPTQAPQKDAQ